LEYQLSLMRELEQCSLSIRKKFNIDTIMFLRCFDDGRYLLSCTEPKWIDYKFEQSFKLTCPIPRELYKPRFHYIIPLHGPFEKEMSAAATIFGLGHALDIIEVGVNYYDMMAFAAPITNIEIINHYSYHLHEFYEFKDTFIEQVTKKLKRLSLKTLILPDRVRPTLRSALLKSKANIYLDNLTKKEKIILKYVIRGYSATKTALALNLSYRTVEGRTDSVKGKFAVHSKQTLIDIIIPLCQGQ
jgi:DNA-binding CsgD family transcriptional regulator